MVLYKMLVMSSPTEGSDAAYNDWYQRVHLPEMLALPGIVSAQRYRLARNLREQDPGSPYLALYEIETDDIDAVLSHITEAAASGRLTMSDVIDTDHAHAVIYEACGEVVSELDL